MIVVWLTPLTIPAFSPWKTTTVLYQHKGNARHMIAQQMRDVGARGYQRRIARSYEMGSFLRWDASVLDTDYRDITAPNAALGPEWMWVGEQRNPFGWKGS